MIRRVSVQHRLAVEAFHAHPGRGVCFDTRPVEHGCVACKLGSHRKHTYWELEHLHATMGTVRQDSGLCAWFTTNE